MLKKIHAGDAGYDITGVKRIRDELQCTGFYTGIALAIPEGHWVMMAPRSSIYKTGQVMCNSFGVIDAGYRGELRAYFYSASDFGDKYQEGDRIAQLIPMPGKTTDYEFVEVDELPEATDNRGEGGFGSTGQ